MNVTSKLPIALFLITSLMLTPKFALASDAPEFLEFYPDCGYEVIGTINVTGNIRSSEDSISQTQISQKMQEMREAIFTKVKEQGARYFVIKDRRVERKLTTSIRLTVKLELLDTCENPHAENGPIAPFNLLGEKLHDYGTYVYEVSTEFTLEPQTKIERPELTDDMKVSLQSGLYGIALGEKLEHVISTFGTPTFQYATPDGDTLLAFGRRHWLRFNQNKLVSAKFEASPFASEFINYLEFDGRFDDRIWAINDAQKRDMTLNASQLEEFEKHASNDAQELHVFTKVYLANNQEYRTEKIVGFELLEKGLAPIAFDKAAFLSNESLGFMANSLKTIGEHARVELKNLPSQPLGKTAMQNASQYLLIDSSTLVEANINAVNKIHIAPSFVKSIEPEERQWRFGEFYYNQPLEEAIALAGEDAFFMYDVIEINHSRYTIKLYSHEHEGKDKIYGMDVSIY